MLLLTCTYRFGGRMIDLNKITTERRNERTMDIDNFSAYEITKIINEEDKNVQLGISKEIDNISAVVEEASNALKRGGRIIYMGAGTSGRLGVLDAVEAPPTYGVDFNTVIGLMAGGEDAFIKAKEGAEDSEELAVEDLENINVSDKDIVIGVAASGRTPYVISGLEYCNARGITTASVAITYNSEIGKIAKFPIEVEVGPEVVTGSTRMKAGTAQKMILNMISTGAMILNGKVYQNLMVDVQQTNKKLVQRAVNIVIDATGVTLEEAKETLEKADGSAKVAIVMVLLGVDADQAKDQLDRNEGSVRRVLND